MAKQRRSGRWYALARAVAFRGSVDTVEALLRTDPFVWLPAPVVEHGVHEFRCTLRPWRLGVVVACSLSGPWVRGDQVARGAHLHLAGTGIGWFVPEIRGDVTVAPGPGGVAMLGFDGQWCSARALVARPFQRYVAHRTVAAFLDGIAGRLAAAVERLRRGERLDG